MKIKAHEKTARLLFFTRHKAVARQISNKKVPELLLLLTAEIKTDCGSIRSGWVNC